MDNVNLAIVEDDRVIRESLAMYFSKQDELSLLIAEDSVEAFIDWLSDTTEYPDILLLDVSLPGMTGIEGIQKIKKIATEVSIVMLTIHDDSERVFNAFKEGADGYLLKNTPLAKIKEGILDIQQNGAPMSPSIAKKVIAHFNQTQKIKVKSKSINSLTVREEDVVTGLVDGLSYKELAIRLAVSIETIRHHIKNIYSKLQVNSKSQVVAKSLKGEI